VGRPTIVGSVVFPFLAWFQSRFSIKSYLSLLSNVILIININTGFSAEVEQAVQQGTSPLPRRSRGRHFVPDEICLANFRFFNQLLDIQVFKIEKPYQLKAITILHSADPLLL
jgi:hypothetical protein